MQRILIIGAAGMAGHLVYTYLTETKKYEVFGTTNSKDFGSNTFKLNIFDENNVQEIIQKLKPHIIINCVGMLIQFSKINPDQTIFGNSYFPHFLKKIASINNAKLIHISTDCVFSGKSGNYTENSFKDATDLYGLSKSLGEIIDETNLTIRTSIIGPELKENGEGLFHWFMNQKGEVNGFRSNFWSGVTTLELAKFIDWIIENPKVGLIHLTNNSPISKFDLLSLFNSIFEKGLIIKDEKDYQCDKSFLNTNKEIFYKVPSYEAMLIEQRAFMNKNSNLYNY